MTNLKKFLFGISNKEILIPELRAFLRKEQREVDAGLRSPRKGVLDDAELAAATFKERAKSYNHDASEDDVAKHYYHPSSIGRCQRELWFQAFNAPGADGDDLLKSHLIFEIGTYGHILFQNLCERAGVLVQRELGVLDHLLKVIGHCDGKLKIRNDTFALEFKTINARGFAKLGSTPKDDHVWQVHIYMALLKLNAALIVYWNKDTSELREFRVPFDTALWEKKLKPRIKAHHEAVRTRTMPDREGTGPESFPCRYCAYNRVCFETFEQDRFLKTIKPAAKVGMKLNLKPKKK
jgi:hypothetical protein